MDDISGGMLTVLAGILLLLVVGLLRIAGVMP